MEKTVTFIVSIVSLFSTISDFSHRRKLFKIQEKDFNLRVKKGLDIKSEYNKGTFVLIAGKLIPGNFTLVLSILNSENQTIIIDKIEITDRLENILFTFDLHKAKRKILASDPNPTIISNTIGNNNSSLINLIESKEVFIRIWDIEKTPFFAHKITKGKV